MATNDRISPTSSFRVASCGVLVAALGFAAGCAATSSQVKPPSTARPIQMEPMKIEVVRGEGGQRIEAFDAATLFEQAGADLNAEHWAAAAAGYDRLGKDFPGSRYAVAALYNAGLALEGMKDFAGAAARYRKLVDEHGDTKDALDALFRLGGCQAEVGNWAASAETFARVLERKEISTGDRVEASARRGLAQYNMKDAVTAERTFRDALAWYRTHEAEERLDSDFFLAMCQYYMGEITHDRFRAAPLRLPEGQMKDDLEAKARLLLTAQAQYVDTARVRHPGWATAAGYQMATLYEEMYRAIMDAPVPPKLSGEAREVYLEELRKTIEPLLRKAIHAHELTQQVAERNGIDNEWVRKSSEQMERLRALVGAPPAKVDEKQPPAAKPAEGAPPAVPDPNDQRSRTIL